MKNNLLAGGTGFRAAKAVAADRGISSVTLWRWIRSGWIRSINIAGRPYIELESLADFDRRAAAGEFAKAHSGAAAESHRTKLGTESSSEGSNGGREAVRP